MSSIPNLGLSIITAARAVTPSKYNSINAAASAVKKGERLGRKKRRAGTRR